MRIEWSPRARHEIDAEMAWIAERRPIAAVRWLERTYSSVQRLSIFPSSGRRVPEFPRVGAREVVSGPYRVLYRIRRDRVVVLTMKHSREGVGAADLFTDRDERS